MAKANSKNFKRQREEDLRVFRTSRALEDDTFMADCWRRTQTSGDTSKCETCHLRFRCYTEDWGKAIGQEYIESAFPQNCAHFERGGCILNWVACDKKCPDYVKLSH